MTKAKYIIAVLFASLILLIVPNISNAAVTVTRDVESGTTMKYSLSGLTLNEEHEYEYGFSATKAEEIKNWYAVTDYSTTTASVELRLYDENMKNIFNATDNGYVTLRDKTDDNKIVVSPTTVDFKIPYLQVTNMTVLNNGYQFKSGGESEIEIASRVRGACPYYQYEKITDENVISKYKEIKAKNGSVLEMQSILKNTTPKTRLECI